MNGYPPWQPQPQKPEEEQLRDLVDGVKQELHQAQRWMPQQRQQAPANWQMPQQAPMYPQTNLNYDAARAQQQWQQPQMPVQQPLMPQFQQPMPGQMPQMQQPMMPQQQMVTPIPPPHLMQQSVMPQPQPMGLPGQPMRGPMPGQMPGSMMPGMIPPGMIAPAMMQKKLLEPSAKKKRLLYILLGLLIVTGIAALGTFIYFITHYV